MCDFDKLLAMAGFFNKMNILFFSLAAAACCCFAATRRQNTDKEIKMLWEKYEKAEASDEPKTALTYLELIKSAAREKHISWDYYDACRKAYQTELRTNWKLRDSLLKKLDSEVDAYADPIVTVFHRLFSPAGRGSGFSKESLLEYIRRNENALRRNSTPEFLSEASANVKVQPLLEEGDFFKNDYQNALWMLSVAASDKNALSLLTEDVGQIYPQSAWLEYYSISTFNYADKNGRKAALESFSERYIGKAAALMADEDLLEMRMDELQMKGNGTSVDYLGLRDECKAVLARCKSFDGVERKLADCCVYAQKLLETLESVYVNTRVSDGEVTLTIRNLKSVNLTLSTADGKKDVWKCTAENQVNSYYCLDTVRVRLPEIDDGKYLLSWSVRGVRQDKIEYEKYSISVACRLNDGRYEIYAADAVTGKPLESVSGFKLNGFTPVPEEIEDKFASKKYEPVTFTSVSPDGRKLLSREVSRNNFYEGVRESSPYSSTEAVILTDCAAFHPGDTVDFKVIAYKLDVKEDGSSEMRTLPAGESVNLELIDAEGKKVEEMSLATNDFGSAAGSFCIPFGRRNGQYRINALVRGYSAASAGITVGDYVLPSFEILADKSDIDVYPGDTIRFTGKVKSYSGRVISADKSYYKVSGPERYSETGRLELSADGRYCISVPSVKSGWYSFELSVSDATGETRVHNGGRGVNDIPNLTIEISDTADGICAEPDQAPDNYRYMRHIQMVSGDQLTLNFIHNNFDGRPTPADVTYTVKGPEGVVASGKAPANQIFTLTIPGDASAFYTVEAEAEVASASGQSLTSGKQSCKLMLVRKNADILASDTEYLVIPGEKPMEALIGTTAGDIWAVVNLVSSNGSILKEELFHMDGRKGSAGSVRRVGFDSSLGNGSAVTMNILWFKDNEFISWSHVFSAPADKDSIPLEISRFTDETVPGRKTSVSFKTDPVSELAVTVYDKSTENIHALFWPAVHKRGPQTVNMEVSSVCGVDGSEAYPLYRKVGMAMSKSASPVMYDAVAVEENAEIPAAGNGMEFENIRDDFKDVVAFEPALRPDQDGVVSFSFVPSGKLSTYIVKAYVHDKKMNTAQISREMVVSLPVEVSLQQPQFLFAGDRYVLRCSVSDTGGAGITGGEVTLSVFDGNDRTTAPLMKLSKQVDFIGGLAGCDFEIPSVPSCESGELGLMVTYSGEDASGEKISDGLMVGVPVYEAVKRMTESHSALLLSGMDRNAVVEQLRKAFTNLDSNDAVVSERKIMDLVKEVLDESASAGGDDVISLMNALTVRVLSSELKHSAADVGDLPEKISECHNSDGGYAWRTGMESSPMTTAYMLTAVSMLREKGILPDGFGDIDATVKYLDREKFAGKQYWYGLSLEQYIYVRSMFPEVRLSETLSKEQKKAVKEYLAAKDEKSMKGNVMGKVKRILSLDRLTSDEVGIALAKAWGISAGTSRKLSGTRRADMNSLRQYAVTHSSGGTYYPNAVMPFRGLLESEIYAHTLLCNLFAGEDDTLADGLRLWLMLQKETQEWNSDPASVLAVAAVMDGEDKLMQTSVISLTAEGRQRFEDIKVASNGFTVGCRYYLDTTFGEGSGDGWVELRDGDTLPSGARVMAKYTVHSDENRSFVLLDTPRPACLMPEDQLSGRYGWHIYRDVRLDGTQWWLDVCPEEDCTFTETFTASQEGGFQCPAAVVKCLYAPHWSANTASSIFKVDK